MPTHQYSMEEKTQLRQLSWDAIAYGLQHHREMPVMLSLYELPLREKAATFVTLEIGEVLRGCIGTLTAYRSLVEDVVANAYAAAFTDPRFYPLTSSEFQSLKIHISILGCPKPLHFSSEAELLAQFHPGIDGIVLTEGVHRGTFLPSVWKQLPDKQQFFRHLKMKAGLPHDYFSPTMQVEKYSVETIG